MSAQPTRRGAIGTQPAAVATAARSLTTARTAAGAMLMALAGAAVGQQGTFTTRSLAPETALAAARAALETCRKNNFQISVAVVDRSGVTQVLLRDRFAGPHSVDAAVRKAWTAASFRLSTAELARETQSGQPMSGIRDVERVLAIGGGLPIEAGGATLGAIGVSGAPGGEADEACAKAGIESIVDAIEF
jgi:uncharacterized protein GlcG (DUF336 family)